MTLYVDGNAVHSFIVSAMNPSTYTALQDFPLGSLSAGQHAIKIVADANGEIAEGDETDNEYNKLIDVSPAATPTPTPAPSPTPTPVPIAQTYTVKNTNDSGPDSLRQAILDANNHPNPAGSIDLIDFNIPGTGVHTITPTTQLAAISEAVVIDGYTQPGASVNTQVVGDDAVLLIALDGSNLAGPGLDLTGGNSTVRGLVMNHFDQNIFTSMTVLLESSNNIVAGNFIGTDASGTVGARNQGVNVFSGANNLVGGTTPADRNIFGGGATQGRRPPAPQCKSEHPGRELGCRGTTLAPTHRAMVLWVMASPSMFFGSPSADITIGGLNRHARHRRRQCYFRKQ